MSTSSLKDFLLYAMINNVKNYRILNVHYENPRDHRIIKGKLAQHVNSEGHHTWVIEAGHALEAMLVAN